MDNCDDIYIERLQNLQLRIHVVGYYPQGECILLVIYNAINQTVIRSVVIDSYKKKHEENQLSILLNSYGISLEKPLDMIIWTHPDRDHSRGLAEIISKYSCKNTQVILPDGVHKWTIQKKHEIHLYDIILKMLKKKEIAFDSVNASPYRANSIILLPLRFHDNISNDIIFSMEILTPFSDDVRRKTEGNKSFDNNDISISILVKFGELKLYLGGDVEDDAIKRIKPSKMENLSFVKIPHHGSNTSIKLPELLTEIYNIHNEIGDTDLEDENICPKGDFDEMEFIENTITGNENIDEEDEIVCEMLPIISVSTCFHIGKADDPLKQVLNLYKPFSKEIFLTDSEISHKYKFGVLTFVYNVKEAKYISTEFNSKGDAGRYYNKQ